MWTPRCRGVVSSVGGGARRCSGAAGRGHDRGWALPDPGDRVLAVQSWMALPDFASVNRHEDGADQVAEALLAHGVGVEVGLWHTDAVEAWLASPHRDRCLRVLIELPDGLDDAETPAEAARLLKLVRTSVDGHPGAQLPVHAAR